MQSWVGWRGAGLALAMLAAGCGGDRDGTAIEGAAVQVSEGRLVSHIGIGAGSRLVPVLEQDCTVPCEGTQRIRAEAAGQDAIRFQLHEGPDDRVASATPLGTYEVLLPRSGATPKEVELRFVADGDGARIFAVDRADGAPLQVARAAR